jgi:hypothetical protein
MTERSNFTRYKEMRHVHWFHQYRLRRELAEADARNLIERFGIRAHQEARLRLIDARRCVVIDANRPECHWERVRRPISQCLPSDHFDTAARYLDD